MKSKLDKFTHREATTFLDQVKILGGVKINASKASILKYLLSRYDYKKPVLDQRQQRCYPSMKRIAEATKLENPSRILRQLEDAKIVEVEEKEGDRGEKKNNVYRLTPLIFLEWRSHNFKRLIKSFLNLKKDVSLLEQEEKKAKRYLKLYIALKKVKPRLSVVQGRIGEVRGSIAKTRSALEAGELQPEIALRLISNLKEEELSIRAEIDQNKGSIKKPSLVSLPALSTNLKITHPPKNKGATPQKLGDFNSHINLKEKENNYITTHSHIENLSKNSSEVSENLILLGGIFAEWEEIFSKRLHPREKRSFAKNFTLKRISLQELEENVQRIKLSPHLRLTTTSIGRLWSFEAATASDEKLRKQIRKGINHYAAVCKVSNIDRHFVIKFAKEFYAKSGTDPERFADWIIDTDHFKKQSSESNSKEGKYKEAYRTTENQEKPEKFEISPLDEKSYSEVKTVVEKASENIKTQAKERKNAGADRAFKNTSKNCERHRKENFRPSTEREHTRNRKNLNDPDHNFRKTLTAFITKLKCYERDDFAKLSLQLPPEAREKVCDEKTLFDELRKKQTHSAA